ncbi:hypothetical protein ACQ4PT_019442 [Festuca glaucescens]
MTVVGGLRALDHGSSACTVSISTETSAHQARSGEGVGQTQAPPWPGDLVEFPPIPSVPGRSETVSSLEAIPVSDLPLSPVSVVGLPTSGTLPTNGLARSRAIGHASRDPGLGEEFFGQLWAIPATPPRRQPPSAGSSLICWVRKDLVRANRLSLTDCFVAAPIDCIRQIPKVIHAPGLIGGSKPSFAAVLRRNSMAGGVPARGRGRGFGLVHPPPAQPPPPAVVAPNQELRPPVPRSQGRNLNPPVIPRQQQHQRMMSQPGTGQQNQVQRYQANQMQRPLVQNFWPNFHSQNSSNPQFAPQQFQQFQRQNYHQFQQRGQNYQQRPENIVTEDATAPQPPPASPAPVEQVMESRYFKMICFNYGDPGHFVGNCIQPKKCFICNSTEHHAHMCPAWNGAHPSATYFGSANRGLGFYHIDGPSKEEVSWLNFKNCAVINVRKGAISGADLEKNLNSIFCKHKKWPWQNRDLDEKNFLVRFPPWKSVQELIEFPAFDLEVEGVNVKIVEWDGDCPSLAELPVVWMNVRGIPPKKAAWKSFAQTVTSIGILMDVDWSSFFKSFYAVIRLQIACRDPVKVPKERIMEIDQKFYLLYFDVEGVDQVDDEDGFDDPGDAEIADFGFDDLEDEEESNRQMETDRVQQNLGNNSAPGGNNNVVHRTCSDVPASWEDIDLEDDIPLVDSSDCKTWCGVDVEDDWCCSPSSFSSFPARMDYKKIDDEVWDFEPVDYGQIDAKAMYRLENSASAAYCSQVLEDFNSAETDEDVSEDDVSEDQFEELPHELVIKLGPVRKNLFPVLESLAEQSGERSRAGVIPIEKKKWGPVVATSRMVTRHHGGQNIIDKAKEYQKRRFLHASKVTLFRLYILITLMICLDRLRL